MNIPYELSLIDDNTCSRPVEDSNRGTIPKVAQKVEPVECAKSATSADESKSTSSTCGASCSRIRAAGAEKDARSPYCSEEEARARQAKYKAARGSLPICKYRKEIIDHVRKHRVILHSVR